MSENVNLEQELAAFDKEFQEAQPMDNWMPPDGEYIVTVGDTKVTPRVDKKSNSKTVDIKLFGVIRPDCVAGDQSLAGQAFQIDWYSPRNFGKMKAALRILNGGEPFNGGIVESVKFLQQSKGLDLKVKVSRRTTDKGEYVNCTILELVVVETQEAAEQTAEQAA